MDAMYPSVGWLAVPWVQLLILVGCVGVALLVHQLPLMRRTDRLLRVAAALASSGCVLLGPLLVAQQQERTHVRVKEEQLAQQREQLRLQQLRERQAQRAALREQLDALPADRFGKYQGQLPAVELLAIRQLDKRMLDAFNAAVETYRTAAEETPLRGPSEWVQFASEAAFAAEIAEHRRLLALSEQLYQRVMEFESDYLAELEQLQPGPAARRIAVAELQRILNDWDASGAYLVRELDVAFLQVSTDAVSFLANHFDRWNFDPRAGGLQFDEPRHREAFGDLMTERELIIRDLEKLRETQQAR